MPHIRPTILALAMGTLNLGLAACGPKVDGQANNATPAGSLPANELAANAIGNAAAAGTSATAELRTALGAAVGTAHVEQEGGVLTVSVAAQGLPRGDHGIHIHMTGTCEGPKFESAGGHWNPASHKHGLDNPQGQHAGDMPNLVVAPDGKGSLDYTLKGGDIAQLLDADGATFVIHAKKDDQKTDPSGDSGDRIACGVFRAG